MAAHFWIFPWIALFFGLAAFAVALLRSPKSGGSRLSPFFPDRVGARDGAGDMAEPARRRGGPEWILSRRAACCWAPPARCCSRGPPPGGARDVGRRAGRGVGRGAHGGGAALADSWELSGLTGLILGAVIPLVIFGAALFGEEMDGFRTRGR